jgi:hypothetical protein
VARRHVHRERDLAELLSAMQFRGNRPVMAALHCGGVSGW